ncbi:MAG TPA: hypothetical protein VKU00_28125 [Chthonomonadaceae bacterium]|nr:hypothetical protein [Chthonomonadaceae bacterium]
MRYTSLRHCGLRYLALASLPILIGCGGGGGNALRSGGNTGGTPLPTTRHGSLARFDVNTTTGKVTITPVSDPNAPGRAILNGGAVSFTSSDLLTVGGDSGKRVLTISLTNNTNEGNLSNARLVIGNISNSNLAIIQSNVAVSTVAGSGATGSTNGYGAAAKFNNPQGIVAGRGANQGSFFIADTQSHTIRQMSGDGTVTTFAGTAGLPGSTDGAGSAALFDGPQQIAVDATGNIFVADSINNVIRRITPTGHVSTIAGTAGMSGNVDGLGNAATFSTPIGIAVNSDASNIYVSEQNDIRWIQYTGGPLDQPTSYTTATVAGSSTPGFVDSSGGAPAFSSPSDLTLVIDQFGAETLYVADAGNNAIRRIDVPSTPNFVVSTVAGNGTAGTADGVGSVATFNQPYGITNVALPGTGSSPIFFVTDATSGLVRMITYSGNEPTQAGNYTVTTLDAGTGFADGAGNVAKFSSPKGLTAVAATGPSATLYIADQANQRIRKMLVSSGALTSGGASSTVTEPVRLVNWDTEIPNKTNATVAWGKNLQGSSAQLQFFVPQGIAGFSFTAYVEADTTLVNLPAVGASYVTTLAGDSIAGAGNGPGKIAEFAQPSSVAVLPANRLSQYGNFRAFIADTFNHRIRVIDYNGVVSTLIGGVQGYADGDIITAKFNRPSGIAAGPDGSLFVADANNHVIRRISNDTGSLHVTTIAGQQALSGSANGAGNVATFNTPAAITVDAGGLIYVTDTGADTVRRINYVGGDPALASSYNVLTLAGVANTPGNADGLPGRTGQFTFISDASGPIPAGIVADTDGKVYVADTGNHAIRVLTRVGFNAVSVSTLAGTKGTSGSTDGTGSGALFNNPTGVAVDTAHNVYVADYSNNLIRRLNPQGTSVTLAGTTSAGLLDGSPGKFTGPRGLVVEASGTILVADYNNHSLRTVQRVISDGQATPPVSGP